MKNVVPNEKCLTEVQLLRYLHDECSVAEEKAIDRHLTHCPMCSDALEGAMSLNAARLERSLKHLDTKINEEYSPKTPIIDEKKPIQATTEPTMTVVQGGKSRRWLWAAAGIAALATASVFLLTKPVESKLETANMVLTDTTISSPSTQTVETETKIAQNSSALEKETAQKAATSPVATTNPVGSSAVPTEGGVKGSEVAVADRSTTSANTPQADEVGIATSESKNTRLETENASRAKENSEAPAANDVAVADVAKKTKDKQVRSQPAAKPSSPYNNYPGAANANIETQTHSANLKKDTDDGLSDYQLGMRAYQKGQYSEAVSSLNRVLAKQSRGDVYENALWYLANGYAKLNKKQESRTLLQRIVAEKGKYATQAADLLK
ncbi:MAG: hypothetical protein JNL70_02595 [Saprospiraceae bacterium]|nr:hypothetical protein [Saprospiraceae bacterium]